MGSVGGQAHVQLPASQGVPCGCREVMLDVLLQHKVYGASVHKGDILLLSNNPEVLSFSFQLPGWKPIHPGARTALHLQVLATGVSG